MPSSPHALNDVISVETLAAFADAWNRHDVDALMTFMTDDCVFETANGPDAFGTRHVAQWRDGRHFVAGDRGISEWLFTGTAADGSRVEANGVDVFTFRDGKIAVKNVFRKDRPRLPPKGSAT